MQILTAPPRDSLTTAQVTDLIQASNLTISAGCELLNADLSVAEDISNDLDGGKVSRSLYATVHGTCDLTLTRALTWGVDLVRPYMTLTDGLVEARFNLGVYCLTTPDRKVGETPATYAVQGFDRLLLLQRQVGADYTVTAGTTYRQALLDVFTDAGLTGALIEGSAADDTLPADKTWALVADRVADPDQTDSPVTWLRIVNDLLRAINYRSVWADENGVFRCQGYQAPADRPVEWTFDADDLVAGTVGEQRTVIEDAWGVPNRWVFRWSNGGTGIEGDGVYTVNNVSDGPTSQDSRGLIWPSVIDFEAASQAKLVELGDRRVAADLSVTSRYQVTVGPFPPAGHADIYRYVDSAAGVDRNVQLVQFDLDLLGADTAMTWEAV